MINVTTINVCDECRTAFYDEGLVRLSDDELAAVLHMGGCIGDHICEERESPKTYEAFTVGAVIALKRNGCACACH